MKPCRSALLILAITAAGAPPALSQDVFSEALGPKTTYGATAVAVDPRSPQVLFAGSDLDGLFTSRDGGVSWQAVEMPGFVTSIEFDPGNPDLVYAAADAIYRSTDGGRTWHRADEAPRGVEFLQVNPHLPGVVYVGLSSTIHRSTDSGATWRRILQGAGMRMLSIDARDAGTLYAAGEGMLKSTDGGDSWVPIEDGIPFEEVREEFEWGELRVTALAADPHESGVLTAGVTEFATVADPPGRIYRSTDGGDSWRMISEVGSWLTTMFVDPVHPEIVLVGSGAKGTVAGTFLSTDGGLSWDQIQGGGARQIVASPGEAGTYFAAMRAGDTRGVVRIEIGGATAVRSTGWGSLKALLAPPSSPR